MVINLNVRIVRFGQVVLEIGAQGLPAEELQLGAADQATRYSAPEDTASLRYEQQYDEGAANYIVPPSTG